MANTDPETRFRQMAARGNPKKALALLDRLDAEDARENGSKVRRRSRKIMKKK